MPWEIQENDPRAVAHKEAMDENAKRQMENRGQTVEKALAAFEKELAEAMGAAVSGTNADGGGFRVGLAFPSA